MEKTKEIKNIQELIKLMHQLKDDERLSVDLQVVPAKKEEKNNG